MDDEAPVDTGRPYGTSRTEFLTRYPELTARVEADEQRFGTFERIATIHLTDGRVVFLARYASAWYINFFRPGTATTDEELQCFLSPEAMIALWGLYEYLRTPQSHAADWDAFLAALAPMSTAQ